MTITKNLTSTLFIMLTIASSHSLHSMSSKKVEFVDPTTVELEFQTYKLFSSIHADIAGIVAITVSKLIDKDCYEEYEDKEFLSHPISLFRFITDKQCTMDHISMANIIKRCLRHSGKSLGEIKGYDGETVFHFATGLPVLNNNDDTELIKLLCLVTGDKAWDIICIKDTNNGTSLFPNLWSARAINTLLSVTPNYQEAWDLIITPNKEGLTALSFAQWAEHKETVKIFESYRPKEQ